MRKKLLIKPLGLLQWNQSLGYKECFEEVEIVSKHINNLLTENTKPKVNYSIGDWLDIKCGDSQVE